MAGWLACSAACWRAQAWALWRDKLVTEAGHWVQRQDTAEPVRRRSQVASAQAIATAGSRATRTAARLTKSIGAMRESPPLRWAGAGGLGGQAARRRGAPVAAQGQHSHT